MKRQRNEEMRNALKKRFLGETWHCSTKGFHMVLRLPQASRALCSFCQGNSRKLTTHRHRQRKMITAGVQDWQLSALSSTARASPWLPRHWQHKKKLIKKRVIICFLLLLHHLRQVRRLCIPNGTSIHAFRLGWFQTSYSEEEISLLGESVRWKFVVNKNVLKYFRPLW